MEVLRREAPKCMEENKNKYHLFSTAFVFCIIAMYSIQDFSRKLFYYIIPTKKFPMGSKIRQTKADMLSERVYKLLFESITSIWLFCIMKDSKFLHKFLLGDQEDPQYFKDFPC